MLQKHLRLRITDEQRFRFASLMSLAADDAGMPNDPEFRSALVAYLEWGTRIALGNSQPDAEVVEHAPVPRWGWGEAPPYRPEDSIGGQPGKCRTSRQNCRMASPTSGMCVEGAGAEVRNHRRAPQDRKVWCSLPRAQSRGKTATETSDDSERGQP